MNEHPETIQSQTELATEEPETLSFAEFLGVSRPRRPAKITDFGIATDRLGQSGGLSWKYYKVTTPDIQIHCQSSCLISTPFVQPFCDGLAPRGRGQADFLKLCIEAK